MNINTQWIVAIFFALQISLAPFAYGQGSTTMSTTTSDPIYTSTNTSYSAQPGFTYQSSVLIGWTPSSSTPPGSVATEIILTTSWKDEKDTVTLDASSYHCSAGVALDGIDTSSPKKIIAKFKCGPTTIGKVNIIDLDPATHKDASGNPCNSPLGGQGAHKGAAEFRICIPMATIARTTLLPYINEVNGFSFSDAVSFTGADDNSKLEMTQFISTSNTNVPFNGGPAVAEGNGVLQNSNGWKLDSGWYTGTDTWLAATTPFDDLQQHGVTPAEQAVPPPYAPGLSYCNQNYNQRDFKYQLRRKDGGNGCMHIGMGLQMG